MITYFPRPRLGSWLIAVLAIGFALWLFTQVQPMDEPPEVDVEAIEIASDVHSIPLPSGFMFSVGPEKAELLFSEAGEEDKVLLWLDKDGIVHSENHSVPLDKLLAVFEIVAAWSELNK